MWQKEFEVARFNGHVMNIISTTIDGGQRLQVSELPYSDLPHIVAMGASAKTITLEVVFVGASSLIDSNALLDAFNESNTGQLEHTWLGELEVCFKTYSQKISTNRGLVNLTLSFIRMNSEQIKLSKQLLSNSKNTSTSEAIKQVESISSAQFIDDVPLMNLDEIKNAQVLFKAALDELVSITSRLNVPFEMLNIVNSAINNAFNSVSVLLTEPFTLANNTSCAFRLVSHSIQSEQMQNDIVDTSRAAQKALLNAINTTAPQHLNVQLIVGAVEMNKDLIKLEQVETFDLAATNKSAALIISDLDNLIAALSDLIDAVTSESTVESLEMYESLVGLLDIIQTQKRKALLASTPTSIKTIYRYSPALSIAYDSKTDAEMLQKLNPLTHPLFLAGAVALGGSS